MSKASMLEKTYQFFKKKFPFVNHLYEPLAFMSKYRGGGYPQELMKLDKVHDGNTRIIRPSGDSAIYYFMQHGSEPERMVYSHAEKVDGNVLSLGSPKNIIHKNSQFPNYARVFHLPEEKQIISPLMHGCDRTGFCAPAGIYGVLDGNVNFPTILEDMQALHFNNLPKADRDEYDLINPLAGSEGGLDANTVEQYLNMLDFKILRANEIKPNGRLTSAEVADKFPDSLVKIHLDGGEQTHWYENRGGVPVEPKLFLNYPQKADYPENGIDYVAIPPEAARTREGGFYPHGEFIWMNRVVTDEIGGRSRRWETDNTRNIIDGRRGDSWERDDQIYTYRGGLGSIINTPD